MLLQFIIDPIILQTFSREDIDTSLYIRIEHTPLIFLKYPSLHKHLNVPESSLQIAFMSEHWPSGLPIKHTSSKSISVKKTLQVRGSMSSP